MVSEDLFKEGVLPRSNEDLIKEGAMPRSNDRDPMRIWFLRIRGFYGSTPRSNEDMVSEDPWT